MIYSIMQSGLPPRIRLIALSTVPRSRVRESLRGRQRPVPNPERRRRPTAQAFEKEVGLFIQTEQTPNPSTLKFLPGRVVMDKGTMDFATVDAATPSPLAKRLF